VTGGCWEGRSPTVRWQSDVWRNAAYFPLIEKWNLAARMSKGCRMMDGRRGGHSQKEG